MYVWQMHFMSLVDDKQLTVYGRTWDEWRECVGVVCSCVPGDALMVCLVHSLRYEFHFFADFVPFDNVFATYLREPIKATAYGKIEFRCTERHSNASLAVYTKQWHAEHEKIAEDDEFYARIRYPWDELDEETLQYSLYDVVGLCEAYRAEMDYWHDTLYTVPLTSTGYVRRICKKAWSKINFYDRLSWMPPFNCLLLLREAFRGGDTHADRYRVTPADCPRACIVHDVASWDRSSSYPDVLINCKYPLGDWYPLRNGREWVEVDEVDHYVHDLGKAIVGRLHLRGLRLRERNWPVPYIPRDKLGAYQNIICDNGRVLSADWLSITITDVDWQLIKKEYVFDHAYFSDCWYCRYRMLPDYFRDVVRLFYERKSALKGAERGSLQETEYGLYKNLLNACYGMAAQNPLKENVYFYRNMWMTAPEYIRAKYEDEHDGETPPADYVADEARAQILEAVNKYNKRAFLPYSVGVWCTAWARMELHKAIQLIQESGGHCVYVDTDSVKFTGSVDFTLLNESYKKRSELNRAYADDMHGKRHYMGVYEYEGTSEDFATMGAKKYAYTSKPDPGAKKFSDRVGLHITIAGVKKEAGAEELYKMGGISAFHAGTVFTTAGGLQGIYNDTAYGTIQIDGHDLYIGSNVCLMPDHYTLGLSGEYSRLIEGILAAGDHFINTTYGGFLDE